MFKRLMAAIIVVGILGTGVQAAVVQVTTGNYTGSTALTTGGGGGWGCDGVTLSWTLSQDPVSYFYTYSYTFSDHASLWMLEDSPNISGGSFSFLSANGKTFRTTSSHGWQSWKTTPRASKPRRQ